MKELYLVKHYDIVYVYTENSDSHKLNALRRRSMNSNWGKLDTERKFVSFNSEMLEMLKDEWEFFYDDPESFNRTPVAECVFKWCWNRYKEQFEYGMKLYDRGDECRKYQRDAIADVLWWEYADFESSIDDEMDLELGEIYREKLKSVFRILKRNGVDLDKAVQIHHGKAKS